MTDTCRIPLGRSGEHEAIVSAEDYAWLTQWRWNLLRSRRWRFGEKLYARRSGPRDSVTGRPTTILMHVAVIERAGQVCPGDDFTVDHGNGDGLDNTRGNLAWATKSRQSANQKPRISGAARERHRAAAAGHEDIPF